MEWYGSPSFRISGITGYDRGKRDIQEGEKDKEQTIDRKRDRYIAWRNIERHRTSTDNYG